MLAAVFASPARSRFRVERPWTLALGALAAGKIVIAILAFALAADRLAATPFPRWIGPICMAVFGGTALLLLAGGRERRAHDLGVFYLLFASAFSDRLIAPLADLAPGAAGVIALAVALHADAFLPVYLWRFVAAFPGHVSAARGQAVARVFLHASLALCWMLFAANAGAAFLPLAVLDRFSILEVFSRASPTGHYWTTIILLDAAAVPFALWRMRFAPPPERRRVRLFLAGLIVGSIPINLDVLLESLIPAFARRMADPDARMISGFVVYPFLLSIPLTTAYAVLVQRALDVRLVVRRALQYALGRYGLLALTAIPFAALMGYFYYHRAQPLTSALAGWRAFGLLALLAAGLGMLRARRPLFEALDRRFFREQYDARTILAGLVDRSRVCATPEELATLLQSEIDRALHLQHVAVFVAEPVRAVYAPISGPYGSLMASSRLAALLAGSPDPLDLDAAGHHSLLGRLPAGELEWLRLGAFQLLVPLLGAADTLLGFVALGRKRSELPFSDEDRLMLSAIAASGALTLENRLLRSTPDGAAPADPARLPGAVPHAALDDPAVECVRCRMVAPASAAACPVCGGQVEHAPVPCILSGKFRLEQRIGAGGMGVVYRALDLELQRTVAIKTLPRLSPERTARMRREARAVARLIHPNLALIFGAETWRGVPMLVFEFLDGGTLADKLMRGRLTPIAAVDLAMVLADVLDQAHDAGILHRDVKPSNIGFTRRGVPKLLDFGLAHLLGVFEQDTLALRPEGEQATTSLQVLRIAPSGHGHLVGTPLYLSPEAIAGEVPDASFDIWSVSMVLFECVAGAHPVSGRNVFETLDRIARVAFPAITESVPDCPAPVAEFLASALSPDRSERPGTARELSRQLERVRAAIS